MIDADDLTPKQIVEELDKYIIGQDKAKRAVAVALRNRYRRRLLSEDLRDEVIPKNILMIGPAGRPDRSALYQGRSDQVHGGRLRRPGRGLDGKGPGPALRSDGREREGR